MQKICSISQKPFTISEFEIDFIKKITPTFAGKSFPIPLPDISPDERTRLRVAHRNEQHLYKNISAFTEKPIISLYRPRTGIRVVTREEWFSDSWDAMEYGQEFDVWKKFFEQFHTLQKKVPRAATVTVWNENSDYTTGTGYCKNCYLINSSEYCEDCYYSKLLQNCKNCIDTSYAYDSEYLYECFNCEKCFNSQYIVNCTNCSDCLYCKNCIGCQDCFWCINLKNKSHYFMNKPCTKEEYEKKIAELHLENKHQRDVVWSRFVEFTKTQPHKYANIMKSENCTGDFIINSKNCAECYDMSESEDCRYVQVWVGCKSVLDCSNMYVNPELSYNTLWTIETHNCHFCLYVFHSRDLWYCEQCFSSKNCFGCVWLRNKEYCIFNKQYTPEAYEKKVSEIITHMQNTGEWGKFFPLWLSPFAYNESLATDYFPLKSTPETLTRGDEPGIMYVDENNQKYRWYEREKSDFQWSWYVPLPLEKYDERIVWYETAMSNIQNCLSGVLKCAVSGKPFKIIRQELLFSIQKRIPLPTLCPDERHRFRMQLRNPRHLYERTCAKTGEKIITTFDPKGSEIIYGEKAFQELLG